VAKKILFGNDAVTSLSRGATQLADVVGCTLGPRGHTVIYEKIGADPIVTKDGVTVAKEVELWNRFENMGATLLREVSATTSDASGDGTTTSTVLANAMLTEGRKLLSAGHDPLELKAGMEWAVARIVDYLKKSTIRVSSKDDIVRVGLIAANGDEVIANLVAEAMDMIGQDGVITVGDSHGTDTALKVIEGMKLDSGYASPEFASEGNVKVEYENPYIMVCDGRIQSILGIHKVLNEAHKDSVNLVIICDSMDADALSALLGNVRLGRVHACVVKFQGVGDKRRESMRDISVVTGGQYISSELGLEITKCGLAECGRADKITIGREDTLIVGGKGRIEDVETRIAQIKSEIRQAWSEFDIEKYQDRLGRLTGGVAVISIGAYSDFELRERKARVEDCLHAVQVATRNGILPGGGVALLHASSVLTDCPEKLKFGVGLVRKALEAPLAKMLSNGEYESDVIIQDLLNSGDSMGWDVNKGCKVDMLQSGIVDPTKVVIDTITHAASVSALILSTAVAVVNQV
jgi:chaperonin GroEL